MIIGITGYVGSGKSTFIDLFAKNFKCEIISTDNFAKEVLNDKKFLYVNNNNFLSNDDAENLKKTLHPFLWKKIKEKISSFKSNDEYILLETALPSEPFFEICDVTICLKNNIERKKIFLKNNREYADEKIFKIIELQNQYSKYYEMCDISIVNDGDLKNLENEIFKLKNNKII